MLKCWSVDSAVLHGTSSSSDATQQNQHSWKSVSFHFFDSCGFTSQAPPGPLHSAVRSCCNTPRPTIFEPDLTGGTGLGSSHSVVRSCSDTPGPTIFEPDLTGGTGWVPCILLCIHVSLCTHVSVFPNQSSLSLISLVAQVWVPCMLLCIHVRYS